MSEQPTIIACTDGSLYAPSVYDHAVWAAKRLQGSILILHAMDIRTEAVPFVDLSGSIGLDARQALIEDLVAIDEARSKAAQAKAEIIIKEAKAHLEKNGIEDYSDEVMRASLLEAIEEVETGNSLLVLGKRGESADFDKLHLGGKLERVIRASSQPVLVAARAFKPIKRMLIAFDGGESALKAVDFAIRNPLLQHLDCLLLAVGKPVSTIETDLVSAKERLEAAGYRVEALHLEGDPEDVIAETVKPGNIDLLVMGAYGHSRIRQFIVGSTTTAMVRTCRIPVLMFR